MLGVLCQFCREEVSPQAVRCPHCQSNFPVKVPTPAAGALRVLWTLLLMIVSLVFTVGPLVTNYKDHTVYSSRPEGVDFAVPGYEGKFGRTVTAQESKEATMLLMIPGIIGLVGSGFLLFKVFGQKNEDPQPGQEAMEEEPLPPKDPDRWSRMS